MDLGIKGKIALITASSRGLGRGCAEQLAGEQCRVAICSRDGAAAKAAAEEIAGGTHAEVVGFGADVSNPEDVGRLLENVRQSLGDPADFGAAAAFLAGTQARYITGQNLLIDGGRYGGLL